MDAIVQHKRSGEHFLATLDGAGTAVLLSVALPVREARDPETGAYDWQRFADADQEPWEEPHQRWGPEAFAIVEVIDEAATQICGFCARTAPRETAIAEGWAPGFWRSDVETHPDACCPACAAEHLDDVGTDNDPIVKPGHEVYLRGATVQEGAGR